MFFMDRMIQSMRKKWHYHRRIDLAMCITIAVAGVTAVGWGMSYIDNSLNSLVFRIGYSVIAAIIFMNIAPQWTRKRIWGIPSKEKPLVDKRVMELISENNPKGLAHYVYLTIKNMEKKDLSGPLMERTVTDPVTFCMKAEWHPMMIKEYFDAVVQLAEPTLDEYHIKLGMVVHKMGIGGPEDDFE